MNFLKIIVIVCVCLVSQYRADSSGNDTESSGGEGGGDDGGDGPSTTPSSTSGSSVPESTVCQDSCRLVEGNVVVGVIILNLEYDKVRIAEIVLLGVGTGTSEDLYKYRQLLTNRLNGSELTETGKAFTNFLVSTYGKEIKITDQLAKVLKGGLSEEEEVKQLIQGIYDSRRNTIISTEELAKYYLDIGPRFASLSERIEASYQQAFWDYYVGYEEGPPAGSNGADGSSEGGQGGENDDDCGGNNDGSSSNGSGSNEASGTSEGSSDDEENGSNGNSGSEEIGIGIGARSHKSGRHHVSRHHSKQPHEARHNRRQHESRHHKEHQQARHHESRHHKARHHGEHQARHNPRSI